MWVIWSRPSRDDILEIADHHDRNEPAIVEEMLDRIDRGVGPLVRHPAIGSPVTPSVRKWQVKGTPFLLFYAVRGDELEVRRVRHVRANWCEDS